MKCSQHDRPEVMSLLPEKRSWPALAPSDSNAPLACLLACIVVTQTASFIAIPVFKHHMTIRAELVVGRDARSADLEKAHHALL
jgi:hypothetical protein